VWGARARGEQPRDAGTERWLLLGTALLLIVRLALELPRPGPVFVSDEIGYLTNARVLSGGIGADLLTTSFYRGGYSTVLAPAVALTDDPELGYRLALAVNVALAASVFPLLYLLLTRCLGVRARSAVGPAFAAACYPALTPTSGLALSENLLFPLVVVWLLCFGEAVMASEERRRALWLAGASLSATALWATHGRWRWSSPCPRWRC
jgi:hypothetical protein